MLPFCGQDAMLQQPHYNATAPAAGISHLKEISNFTPRRKERKGRQENQFDGNSYNAFPLFSFAFFAPWRATPVL
jgi:hypothetical protein